MSQIVTLPCLPADENGNRRVRICYFVHDDKGAVKTKETPIKGKLDEKAATLTMPAMAGYIACDPKRSNLDPARRGKEIMPLPRTNDPRAVTCKKCMETEVFKRDMAELNERIACAQAV